MTCLVDVLLGTCTTSWQISWNFRDCKMLIVVHPGAWLKYAQRRNCQAESKRTCLIKSTVLKFGIGSNLELVLDTQPYSYLTHCEHIGGYTELSRVRKERFGDIKLIRFRSSEWDWSKQCNLKSELGVCWFTRRLTRMPFEPNITAPVFLCQHPSDQFVSSSLNVMFL